VLFLNLDDILGSHQNQIETYGGSRGMEAGGSEPQRFQVSGDSDQPDYGRPRERVSREAPS